MTSKLVDSKEAGSLIGLKSKKFILQMVREDKLTPVNFSYYQDTNGYLFVREEVLELPEKFPDEYQLAKYLDGEYISLTAAERQLKVSKSKLLTLMKDYEIPLETVNHSRYKHFISNKDLKRIEELIVAGKLDQTSTRQQHGFLLFQAVEYEGDFYRITGFEKERNKVSLLKHGSEIFIQVPIKQVKPMYMWNKSENKKRSRLFSKVQILISSVFGDGGSLIDVLYRNLPKNYIRISFQQESDKVLVQIMHHSRIDTSQMNKKDQEEITEAMEYFNYKKVSGDAIYHNETKIWEILSNEKILTLSLPPEVIQHYEALAKSESNSLSVSDYIERKLISEI